MILITIPGISSGHAILPVNLPEQNQAINHVRVIEGENIVGYARPLYTSLDNPSNHEVATSAPHDGVARLILITTEGTFGCSGTLANDRVHVITAAHCVTDNNGDYILSSGYSTFEGNSESIVVSIDAEFAKSKVHPNWDGDFIKGNDIAILKLTSSPPLQVPGIPHDVSGDSLNALIDKAGYGLSGYFDSGTDSSNYPFGTKREGQNKYDAFADTMYLALGLTPNVDFIPGAIYQYDSDDGASSHDAFGFFFGKSDLGLGNSEVMSAFGDSGGPTFEDGKLVGISSYGITLQYTNKQTSDCTKSKGSPKLDSSCGEFAGDTRVSYYGDYIDSVLNNVFDSDNDGVADSGDNCPNISNTDQSDLDSDSIGDVCDSETVITLNTILEVPTTLAGNLIVDGAQLTVAPGATLDIDSSLFDLIIRSGGSLLVKSGGEII